jgi:hypothetical protein
LAETGPTLELPRTRRKVELGAAAACVLAFLIVSVVARWPHNMTISEAMQWFGGASGSERMAWFQHQFGIILAAGLTLIMYSFLYRDNPLFKIVENLYVGVGLGYGAIMTWYLSLKPEIVDPLFRSPTHEDFIHALKLRTIPILLGFMLVTRISRRFSWPSRYSYALMIGWGAGIGIPITVHTFVLKQLTAAVKPLGLRTVADAWSAGGMLSGDFWSALGVPLGGLLILLGTVSVLYYFFFSLERGPVGKVVSKIGVLFLMVSFGASFGYTVMGRISLFIDRAQFLLGAWLGIGR